MSHPLPPVDHETPIHSVDERHTKPTKIRTYCRVDPPSIGT